MRLPITIYLLLLLAATTWAQSGMEKQMLNRVEKGNWSGAEEQLRKSIRKDSLNPEARFLLSVYFGTENNPGRNIDSSYSNALQALLDFNLLPAKERDKLKKLPIDSTRLLAQLSRADSASFDQARRENSENSYNRFLAAHATSNHYLLATRLRDEILFANALQKNTAAAFLDYLTNHPTSRQTAEAQQKYEKLSFEEQTGDGALQSYERFYNGFPSSPYRAEAERNIFEISTASGKPAAFTSFIRSYPHGVNRSRAESILYHLSKEEEIAPVAFTLNDSLKRIQLVEQGYWVPVLRNGKFGFMDRAGIEMIAPQFDTILPEYLCGNIRADFLLVAGGIIGRSGKWIIKGAVLEAADAGAGFLKVNLGNCIQAVHKSGYTLGGACYSDMKIIAHRFVAVQDHSRWGLKTLTGRWLQPAVYDDVAAIDEIILFTKNGKKVLATADEVAAVANHKEMPVSRVFDDLQRLGEGTYLVKNGSLEGVVNGSLEFTVPLDRQVISRVQQGLVLKRDQKYVLAGISDNLAAREFRKFQFYAGWLKLEEDHNLQLYDIASRKTIGAGLDSLWFENEIAFASRHDSLTVYLRSGALLKFDPGTRVTFIKSADSTTYFYAAEKKKLSVFDARHGKRLFTFDFDDIEYTGSGVFTVTARGKKGLISDHGKIVIPVEYSAIIKAGPDLLSLLKDKRFGMYNLKTRKLLKPLYERNVIAYSGRWLVAYKDNGYGFIGWDGAVQGKYEFEEIQPWNDTSALVKKNFQWMIYGIRSQRVFADKIKDYRLVRNTPAEKVMLIHRDAYFGVTSCRSGEILPATFTDIINLGSDDQPLYFVEKNVEEASIYVVIYYDQHGKLLRKQVYEAEEYEKIFCTEK